MIVITGATGKTGSKIANLLLNKDQIVRVISRSEDKLSAFKERGAETAIGDQTDVRFLTRAFNNCDSVYLMVPPKFDTPDIRAYYNLIGDVAIDALQKSGVKKVVFLSSMGAELSSGTGPVIGLHDLEAKLQKLNDIDIAILRPAYFMENIFSNIPMIKLDHINGNIMPPDVPFAMIATRDIAKKAAELLTMQSLSGHTIFDLFGDRISFREATRLIGQAIGIPDLPYVKFTPADAFKSMVSMGLSENMAASLVEMSITIGKGLVHPTQTDQLKPNTNTDFKTFANDIFKPVFES